MQNHTTPTQVRKAAWKHPGEKKSTPNQNLQKTQINQGEKKTKTNNTNNNKKKDQPKNPQTKPTKQMPLQMLQTAL